MVIYIISKVRFCTRRAKIQSKCKARFTSCPTKLRTCCFGSNNVLHFSARCGQSPFDTSGVPLFEWRSKASPPFDSYWKVTPKCKIQYEHYGTKGVQIWWNQLLQSRDYRREVLSCVTNSNPNLLFNSEKGVNPGRRSWKKQLSEWPRSQKAIGGIYFTKKWKVETLQPGLEYDNIKPRLKIGLFNWISWPNGSFFGGDDRGFLKETLKTYLVAPMSPWNSSFFSHL